MSPLSERGISPQDDYDPDRRAFVKNIGIILGVGSTFPGLLACKPGQVGGAVAGTLSETLASTQEEDVSKLSPKVLWRGEFKHAKDYLDDLFWTGEASIGGEEPSGAVVAREFTSGEPLWTKHGIKRYLGFDSGRGLIYFLTEGKFIAFDEKTGNQRWEQPFPELNTGTVGAAGEEFGVITFADGGSNFLKSFDRATGRQVFTRPISAPKHFALQERYIKSRVTLQEEDGRGNTVRISSFDLSSGEEKWSRDLEAGWYVGQTFGKNTLVLKNRDAKSVMAISKDSGEILWRRENTDFRQSSYDYFVIEDLDRRIYKLVVDQQGRVSDWEADARNAYMWIAGPPVVGSQKEARYWFWRDFSQAWVQLINISSGTLKWESREFHATGDLDEFTGGIGVCVGQLGDDKRDQLIAVDMGNGHIKWTKELNWVKGDSRYIGGDFGMVTYTMSGIKYYLNPQNGDLIATLDIGNGFGSGGAGEKLGFHYAFDEPRSMRKVVVTGV